MPPPSLTLMNTQVFLLYICIVQFVSCDGSPDSVTATVGSTTFLPCKCTTEPGKTPHVQWKIDTETVFEREGKEWFDGEGYEGRVDVPEHELNKGTCSLVLKNITVNDAAVYMCYEVVKRTKRSISTKLNLIQEIQLSVNTKKTQSPDLLNHGLNFGSDSYKGDSRINLPSSLFIILSFLTYLLLL